MRLFRAYPASARASLVIVKAANSVGPITMESQMSFMPFINEFHYDNTGTDVGEFIEIAGLAGTDLSQYSIVRYNGSTTPTAASLSSAGGSLSPLSGVITDMQNGYGVISFALPANGLENGGSDGFALVGPGNVVLEFLSYEGVISTAVGAAAGLTSTDVGVSESGSNPLGTSIARVGTGAQGSGFTWVLDVDDTPGAINNSQSFIGGSSSSFSINDLNQSEGNAGAITFSFTVSRSSGTGAATVDFATADASATIADADYVATSGTLNFADGELSKTVSVTVNGDTANEANETFTVNLSNATGGVSIADGQGVGTIVNDDSTITRIHTIQGAQHSSPLVGQSVTIQGIVTAVDSNGFYIQESDATADANVATSEGIFVFTSGAPNAMAVVGNELRLTGTVSEFFPGGASTGNLSTTELVSTSAYQLVSTGNALPAATVIGNGGRALPTANIQDDTPYSGTDTANFDPANDGMDFYESLEGMLVTVHAPKAVAGTTEFSEIWTVADNGANATGLSANGTIVINEATSGGLNVTNSGPGSDFNPERIQIDVDTGVTPGATVPLVNAGAVLNDVTGVIDYDFGNYQIVPTHQLSVATASTLQAEVTTIAGNADTLTIASYNTLNLDINDSPGETQADQDVADGRFAAIAQQIINNLGSPDIIGLQEIQDNSGGTDDGTVSADQVLQALVDAIVAAGGPTYSFIDNTLISNNANGGQPGANIRNTYLYNDSRVDLVPGSVTTTTNAQTDFAGSRLPLVATFSFNGEDVTLINNHFSSKGGSTPLYGTTQLSVNGSADQRLVQAQNVADYVTSLGAQAKVVVLGDLNEFSGEESLAPLTAAGLVDMDATLPQSEQYSYIFDGNAQVLDHVMLSSNLTSGSGFDIVHVNPEFAFTSSTASDHDPSVVSLNLPAAPQFFTLQLLAFMDQEGGGQTANTAYRLAGMVQGFENQIANTLVVSGGDTFLPGPFNSAGADPSLSAVLGYSTAPGRPDVAILNAIGIDAAAIGNHEFDLTSSGLASAMTFAAYPYLSANLNTSADSALNSKYVNTIANAGLETTASLAGKIAPSAVTNVGGENIGIVGLSPQNLKLLSSPTGSVINGSPNGEINAAVAAAHVQAAVNDLIAQGVNKIILTTDSNSVAFDTQVAQLVHGIDIVIAGGSHNQSGDANDVLLPGDTFTQPFPLATTDADGNTVLIISSDDEYKYLDRLVVDFDANGVINPASLNDVVNGAYAATDVNVAAAWGVSEANLATTAYAAGTKAAKVKSITDAIDTIVTTKDGNVFGYSDVYLEGDRLQVRYQETNLGDLTADANAATARAALGLSDTVAVVSIKNGGGVRASIGTIMDDGSKVPNHANAVKGEGAISQLDVENSLRFNNALMVFDTTAQGLLNILNSPNTVVDGNGGFIQVGGIQFSYDPTKPVGSRVQDVALVNEMGEKVAIIADNGVVNPNAPSLIHGIVLNFTANGGDSYNFKANADNFRYVLADGTLSAAVNEVLDFTAAATITTYAGSTANLMGEQKAMGDYLADYHSTPGTAFDLADTPEAQDLRIQNQALRADTVLSGPFATYGADTADVMNGTTGADWLKGIGGDDKLNGSDGDDILNGGAGRDLLDGGVGIDTASYADAQTGVAVDLGTRKGSYGEAIGDRLVSIENITGSAYGDALFGNAANNVIDGGAGADVIEGGMGLDTLSGGDGDDMLNGGKGIDQLAGGAGVDIFAFIKGDTGKTVVTADSILDFVSGVDIIDLSAIDANARTPLPANEAFTFVGTAAFSKVAGELRYEVVGADAQLSADWNGDGKADFMVLLTSVTSLSSGDFIL